MRVVFFGTPEFAVPSLRRLAGRFDVALVVSQPDRPAGRHLKLTAPPVALEARALGLEVLQPVQPNASQVVERIRKDRPDILVVVAYGRLIRQELLALCPAGVLNLHPSLLPKYRGASPIQGAIYAGESVTGVTVMALDEGLDSGPIVSSRAVPLASHETADHARERLAIHGADLLVETLPAWVDGRVSASPQDESLATLTRPVARDDAWIDVRRSARAVYDQWRAFQPWPGASLNAGDIRIKLLHVEPSATEGDRSPGAITHDGDRLVLACGEASGLAIHQLQPEGRSAMTADEFVRGYAGLLRRTWGVPFPTPQPPLVRPARA